MYEYIVVYEPLIIVMLMNFNCFSNEYKRKPITKKITNFVGSCCKMFVEESYENGKKIKEIFWKN